MSHVSNKIPAVSRGALAIMAAALLPLSCKSGYQAPPVTALVTAGSVTPAAQLQRGHQLYQMKCGNCHSLQDPAAFSADRLKNRILPVMAGKAGLSPAEADDVLAYLLAARELKPGTRTGPDAR